MILPLMNAMTVKTATSTSSTSAKTQAKPATGPGGRKAGGVTRAVLMMVGVAAAVAMIRIAKRRSR